MGFPQGSPFFCFDISTNSMQRELSHQASIDSANVLRHFDKLNAAQVIRKVQIRCFRLSRNGFT